MIDFCMLLLLSVVLQLPSGTTSTTAIRFTVLDGRNTPVVGLALTIHDTGGSGIDQTIMTDAQGVAIAQPLTGPFFVVTQARHANGQTVPIDATTLHDGLRLGVIPGEERSVGLRLDSNLLFVDPDTIFAGGDTVGPTMILPSPVMTSTPSTVAFVSPVTPDTATPAPQSRAGWILGGLVLTLIAIPIGLYLRQVRRYQHQRRIS